MTAARPAHEAVASPDAGPRLVFILGTGRCGSSLVHELLARHEGIGFITNIEDRSGGRLPSAVALSTAAYRRIPHSWTRKGQLRLAPSEGYRLLDAKVSPILSQTTRDLTGEDVTPWLQARLHAWVDGWSGAQPAPVFSHKLTGWPRARFLHAVWPDARFVHVVRDGRAVANSLLQMPWWRGYRGPQHWRPGPLGLYEQEWLDSGRSHVVLAGIAWKMYLDAFAACESVLPARQWLTVRYEDLVTDRDAVLDDLLAFHGLEPDATFRRRVQRTHLVSARTDAWRRDLREDQGKSLTESLQPHLTRYGYQL